MRRGPPDLALVSVLAGRLAVTHRPKKADLPSLRAMGVTHLVTLLTEREGARDLGTLATGAGLTWIWCPLEGADTAAPVAAVRGALEAARAALREGGSVVVHCSAGIHRTGMFAHALLRVCGLDPTTARSLLHQMRAVTDEGVGEDRIEWGHRIASDLVDP